MVDDNLALLVGRVILAFGALDQALYGAISRLQMKRQQVLFREGGGFDMPEIDDRFRSRRKQFRLLCNDLKPDKSFMSRVDRHVDVICRLELPRAHLAHGLAYEREGRVHIHDHREIKKLQEAMARLMKRRPTREGVLALHEKHTDISYSADEMTKLAADIAEATATLVALEDEAWEAGDARQYAPR